MRYQSESLKMAMLCLASTVILGYAHAGDEKDKTAEFQARYDIFTQAYLRKDLKTLGKMLAPDFKTGSYKRPIDRATLLDGCAKSNGFFKTRYRKVLGVNINQNKATTMVDQITIGTFPDPKSGIKHHLELRIRCYDTWIKSPVGWQLKHMKTVHTKATEDGKPYKGKVQS
jgi:hypothetical protein